MKHAISHRKKGFTIAELVIVIVVIAVLAAVLIPLFANLIERARLSVDQQTVDGMNQVLQIDEILNGKPASLNAAKAVLGDGNYRGNIAPTAKDYEFYWIPAENRVVLVKMNGDTPESVVYPKALADQYATLPTEWYRLSESSDVVVCPHTTKKYVAVADGNTSTHHMEICSVCSTVTLSSEAHDTTGTDGACSKCGWKAPGDSHEHVYSSSYLSDCKGHHWGVCSCGLLGASEDCTYVNGKCEKCGYADPAATGDDHTHQFTYVPVDPYDGRHTRTCTVEGCSISGETENCAYGLNKKCIYCGADMPDQGGEHTHTWSNDWAFNDDSHWHQCTGCAEKRDEAAHTFTYTELPEQGEHLAACSVCGHEITEEHTFDAEDGKCKCGATDPNRVDLSKAVYLYPSGTFTITGEGTTSAAIRYDSETPSNTFDSIADALAAAAAGGCIKLNASLTESVSLTKSITLDLNGKTLTGNGGSVISFYEYGTSAITLNLFDSGATGKITGGVAANRYQFGGGICVFNGKLNMYGGNITGNTAVSGGGVSVVSMNGKAAEFEMFGGKITGNLGKSMGFGVYVKVNDSTDPSASFKMHAGEISDNKAASDGYDQTYGGGVYVKGYSRYGKEGVKSIFEMTGGTISGNEAVSGGGAYLDANTQAAISGGSIIGNVAKIETTSIGGQGGGIYVKNATLTLSDVIIRDNAAQAVKHGQGGGICAEESDVTVLAGTVISSNRVSATQVGDLRWLSASGAGIYWYDVASSANRLKLLGGSITDNTIESNISGNSCAGAGVACAATGWQSSSYPHVEISANCNISGNTGALKGTQVYTYQINVHTDRTDFSKTATDDFVYASSLLSDLES